MIKVINNKIQGELLNDDGTLSERIIKSYDYIELKDNLEYNTARQTVLDYFKVSSYEELEAKRNKGKQLKAAKKIKQELEESIKYLDEVDLTEQEQRKRA